SLQKNGYDRVMFVGLGPSKKLTEDRLRQVFAAAGKELKNVKASSVAVWTSPFTNDDVKCEDVVFAAAEGIGLGSYQFEGYKTDSNEKDIVLETLSFLTNADEDEMKAAFEVGKTYAEAVNSARNLVNLPPNMLTATKM